MPLAALIIVVAVGGLAAPARAQQQGWLAVGPYSGSSWISFESANHAESRCGFRDCQVRATFTACMAVAYSRETVGGRIVWTWSEADDEQTAYERALAECREAGGTRCTTAREECVPGFRERPARPMMAWWAVSDDGRNHAFSTLSAADAEQRCGLDCEVKDEFTACLGYTFYRAPAGNDDGSRRYAWFEAAPAGRSRSEFLEFMTAVTKLSCRPGPAECADAPVQVRCLVNGQLETRQ